MNRPVWTEYKKEDRPGPGGIRRRTILLEAMGEPLSRVKDVARHPLIGWGKDVAGIMAADWLGRAAPEATFVYRTSSLVNQLVAAKAGIGVALLPCYLGDGHPELARALADPIPKLAAELWIVTHADLKGTARVCAFFDIVGDGLKEAGVASMIEPHVFPSDFRERAS